MLPFIMLLLVFVGAYFTASIISSEAVNAKSTVRKSSLMNRVLIKSTLKAPDPRLQYPEFEDDEFNDEYSNVNFKPLVSNHYTCPPTTIHSLRKRYGTRRSIWGEWSCAETRRFYKQQLPRCLQIDGALGLSLEERAQLAAEARHALRLYSRERCHLVGRLAAELYDGIRHYYIYGSWRTKGLTWSEIKEKYRKEAFLTLGPEACADLVDMYVYRRIIEKACSTNPLFDEFVEQTGIYNDETAFMKLSSTLSKIFGDKLESFLRKQESFALLRCNKTSKEGKVLSIFSEINYINICLVPMAPLAFLASQF